MPTKAGDGGKAVCQSGDQPGCVRGDTCQRLSERASAALYAVERDLRTANSIKSWRTTSKGRAFKHSRAGLDKFVFCLTPDCT